MAEGDCWRAAVAPTPERKVMCRPAGWPCDGPLWLPAAEICCGIPVCNLPCLLSRSCGAARLPPLHGPGVLRSSLASRPGSLWGSLVDMPWLHSSICSTRYVCQLRLARFACTLGVLLAAACKSPRTTRLPCLYNSCLLALLLPAPLLCNALVRRVPTPILLAVVMAWNDRR